MQKSFRKHNLKLAIFLSYREPSEGGGFTITDDILNVILKKYKRNRNVINKPLKVWGLKLVNINFKLLL